MSSFLIFTSSYGDEAAFIVACDDVGLRWLSRSLHEIAEGRPFTIGDGHPVDSDGKCIVEVSASPIANTTAITRTGAVTFRWSMPAKQADDYAYLIEGMIEFPDACHQYLETALPDNPVILVSKGEYDTEALRKMRDA